MVKGRSIWGWVRCALIIIIETIMSNFDERSGVVYCKTPWGQWAQTVEEVFVEVEVVGNIRAKDIVCVIKTRYLSVSISGKEIFKAR